MWLVLFASRSVKTDLYTRTFESIIKIMDFLLNWRSIDYDDIDYCSLQIV